MTTQSPPKFAQFALWAPIVIVPVAFFAMLPWLAAEQSDTVVLGITAACAIFVMGYSHFLAARLNRGLDEVQIAGQRFSQTKGMAIGYMASALVIIFPPALNALADLANTISAGSPDKAIKLGIAFGFMMVVILQTMGILAVSYWWERRIRAPE